MYKSEENYSGKYQFSFCNFDNTGDPWFYLIQIPRGNLLAGKNYYLHIRMKDFMS